MSSIARTWTIVIIHEKPERFHQMYLTNLFPRG
jgi:hypothetical protein